MHDDNDPILRPTTANNREGNRSNDHETIGSHHRVAEKFPGVFGYGYQQFSIHVYNTTTTTG